MFLITSFPFKIMPIFFSLLIPPDLYYENQPPSKWGFLPTFTSFFTHSRMTRTSAAIFFYFIFLVLMRVLLTMFFCFFRGGGRSPLLFTYTQHQHHEPCAYGIHQRHTGCLSTFTISPAAFTYPPRRTFVFLLPRSQDPACSRSLERMGGFLGLGAL